MNRYYLYWGIAALLLLEAAILYFKKRYKSSNRYYATVYQKRLLLTKHEWKNYMSIRDALEAQGLYVCPKVRLLDLVEPKRGAGEYYQALLNKVQSKHVDFTVCDERLNVLLILELDDSSHNAPDRKNGTPLWMPSWKGLGTRFCIHGISWQIFRKSRQRSKRQNGKTFFLSGKCG